MSALQFASLRMSGAEALHRLGPRPEAEPEGEPGYCGAADCNGNCAPAPGSRSLSGRLKRCANCGQPRPAGQWCPTCKAAFLPTFGQRSYGQAAEFR